MSFLAYDLAFLGIFVVLLGIFLYAKRKNLKREGLLLLYKTSWGIKLIHRIGERHQKGLKFLGYVSIIIGYLLMAGVIYFIGKIVWSYVFNPAFVKAVKVPPIMPLVPYINKIIPGLGLPPFYFTYWIIIIAVIAILHEFAHGIFAARSKVKVNSTGFGFFPFFLPIFLVAFVEPDEKQMKKKKVSDQLAVLSAGTFANFLTAIVSFGILIGFFALAFAPSGVVFNPSDVSAPTTSQIYAFTVINISSITAVGNTQVSNPSQQKVLGLMNNSGFNEIKTLNGDYLITKASLKAQSNAERAAVYYDSPALREGLAGVILDVNGNKTRDLNQLGTELLKYSPGDSVVLTLMGNNSQAYNKTIVLGANPGNSSRSWLGIEFLRKEKSGIINEAGNIISSFRDSNTYYASEIGDMGIFIYNLLWWLTIIALSVALINMLPMGIFDGGRFFYLTVLAITKKEKAAMIAYKFMTYIFLLALFITMFFWVLYAV